jgi:hypothetical protein
MDSSSSSSCMRNQRRLPEDSAKLAVVKTCASGAHVDPSFSSAMHPNKTAYSYE